MYKKCNVVMLSTDEKAIKGDIGLDNQYLYSLQLLKGAVHEIHENARFIKQHLYITSELPENLKKLEKYGFKNVIATTNKDLELPEPSREFIEEYIKAYNEGKPIKEVLVEYEGIKTPSPIFYANNVPYYSKKLIVKLDNTINIKKIKDSWSRDEVIDLCNKAYQQGNEDAIIYAYLSNTFTDWLKKNL